MVPHMHIAYGLKHVIKYHTAIKWADRRATGTYFCEHKPKMSKFPLTCDFMAISGSVDSTTSLAYSFYVTHMVLNTSKSITKVIKCLFELFINR